MNVPRSLFYLEELNGQLYAVAGWTAVNEDTPTVERYTPSLDNWQQLKNFPLDVHEHAGQLVIRSLSLPLLSTVSLEVLNCSPLGEHINLEISNIMPQWTEWRQNGSPLTCILLPANKYNSNKLYSNIRIKHFSIWSCWR